MKYCKNCGSPLHDKYCGQCGQKGNFERISLAFISHEIFHFFSHIEKDFLFTSLQMVKAPGKTVNIFIGGARKKYQPPISYFLIWITIYILFLYFLEKLFGDNIVTNYQDYFGPMATTKFAIRHLSLVLTIVIPFQALYLYLPVTKKNVTYFESIVAILFLILAFGTFTLMRIYGFPAFIKIFSS